MRYLMRLSMGYPLHRNIGIGEISSYTPVSMAGETELTTMSSPTLALILDESSNSDSITPEVTPIDNKRIVTRPDGTSYTVTLVPQKGQRGKHGSQRVNESFSQYQNRLADARMESALKRRAKRQALRNSIVDKAMEYITLNRSDRTDMTLQGKRLATSYASAILDGKTGLASAIQDRITRHTQTDRDLQESAVVASVPTNQLGKRVTNDIVAGLTLKFGRGFSSVQGKRKGYLSEKELQRTRENEKAYYELLSDGKTSHSDPFKSIGVLTPASINGTPVHYERFVPSSMEVYTQTERLTPKGKDPLRSSDGMILSHYSNGRIGGIYPPVDRKPLTLPLSSVPQSDALIPVPITVPLGSMKMKYRRMDRTALKTERSSVTLSGVAYYAYNGTELIKAYGPGYPEVSTTR